MGFVVLRASPPIPPNANGGRGLMPGPGHGAETSPALTASGPGREGANATRGVLRGACRAPQLAHPLPSAITACPPPSFRDLIPEMPAEGCDLPQ
jgi:hypothetical protein